MDILIPIETTAREMIYKIFLCNKLAYLGFNCYLGNKAYVNYLAHKKRNFIYIDKGYHKGKSLPFYKTIKENNGLIISLDEEGAVDYQDHRTLLNTRYPKEMLDAMDYVFLWGKKQYKLITKNYKKTKKLHITGHPRFELLKKKYHLLYRKESDIIRKKYGNFILINTNIGYANSIRGSKFVIENYGKRFPDVKTKIEQSLLKRDFFVHLVKELSSHNKKIVFRPHPEESQSFYSELFSKYNNVSVVYEGSVIPWLLASEFMIHPDCTTAIESDLLGKMSISLLPPEIKTDYVANLPVAISESFRNIEDLLKFIDKLSPNSQKVNSEKHSYVDEYFSFSKDSIDSISNKMQVLLLKCNKNVSNSLSFRDKFYFNIKSLIFRLNSLLKRNALSDKKLGDFSYNSIMEIDSICKNIDNDFSRNEFTKLVEQLYLFKST